MIPSGSTRHSFSVAARPPGESFYCFGITRAGPTSLSPSSCVHIPDPDFPKSAPPPGLHPLSCLQHQRGSQTQGPGSFPEGRALVPTPTPHPVFCSLEWHCLLPVSQPCRQHPPTHTLTSPPLDLTAAQTTHLGDPPLLRFLPLLLLLGSL